METTGLAKSGIRLLFAVLVAGGIWHLREQVLKQDSQPQQTVQLIRLIDTPQPPPAPEPPPQKVEEQPQELRHDPWAAVPDGGWGEGPPGPSAPSGPGGFGDRLGLDDDASGGGSDAFGLLALKGGRDVATIGNEQPGPGRGSGGSGNGTGGGGPPAWAWYGGAIQKHVESVMRGDSRLKASVFQVVLQIWVADDGRIVKCELLKASKDAAVNEALMQLLTKAPRMLQPPPSDMPQPVRLRITSKMLEAVG